MLVCQGEADIIAQVNFLEKKLFSKAFALTGYLIISVSVCRREKMSVVGCPFPEGLKGVCAPPRSSTSAMRESVGGHAGWHHFECSSSSLLLC